MTGPLWVLVGLEQLESVQRAFSLLFLSTELFSTPLHCAQMSMEIAAASSSAAFFFYQDSFFCPSV